MWSFFCVCGNHQQGWPPRLRFWFLQHLSLKNQTGRRSHTVSSAGNICGGVEALQWESWRWTGKVRAPERAPCGKRASVQTSMQLKSSCSRRLQVSGPNSAAADILVSWTTSPAGSYWWVWNRMHVFVGGDGDSGGLHEQTPPLQRSAQSRFRANSCSVKKNYCSEPGGLHFRVTGTNVCAEVIIVVSNLQESKIWIQHIPAEPDCCRWDTGGRVKYSCLQRDCQSLVTSPDPCCGAPHCSHSPGFTLYPSGLIVIKTMNCCSMKKTIFSDVLNVNGGLKTCCYRSQALIKNRKSWSSGTSREVLLLRAGGSERRAARWAGGSGLTHWVCRDVCRAASDAPLLHLLHSVCPPHLHASPCSSHVSSRLRLTLLSHSVGEGPAALWAGLVQTLVSTTEQKNRTISWVILCYLCFFCVKQLHHFKWGEMI